MCVSTQRHYVVVAHEYMAPSELSKLTLDELKARRKPTPTHWKCPRRSLITSNTARSFCMSLIRSGRHFSPLRSLLLMSCLVIGSFRPFSLLTLPIMLDATKPSHLTPFSEVAAICNGQTMAQILLVALRLSLISSECLLRSSSSILSTLSK
jgi:hypothetical protein